MPETEKTKWLRTVLQILDAQDQRVFGQKEFSNLLEQHLPPDLNHVYKSPASKLNAMISTSTLRTVDLFPAHQETAQPAAPTYTKYVWRHATQYDLALSLRPASYISHLTAASLHDLAPRNRTIFVNKEQSPKPAFTAQLSQQGIDRAFSSKPRQTTYILTDGKYRYVLLNGKHTGNLGVTSLTYRKRSLLAANLPRTVIDMIVRPQYSGGAAQILKSVRAARPKIRILDLLDTLRELRHAYPYHQALGFYLEAAGFSDDETRMISELGLSFDFYLEQGSAPMAYHPKWRIHYPVSLSELLTL